ncbi:MAG: cytochrome ubiquinol oxidase subunit I [Rhodospirillales bacterium]
MEFDALLLSRFQFAFTIAFHIVFPALTIGLASWLVVLEYRWLRTKHRRYLDIYKFWAKIFAVSFGLGVVSGVVLSYQLGTNWSRFSDVTGNVMGPMLAYEVLTAFFLEAGFLGIMLFGWDRVGPKLHFTATVLVAVGTLISSFWILSANSWMQTPAGHEMRDGIFYAKDWWAIVFNPSFPYRLAHMVLASYLTTALVVAGVGAWYLVEKRFVERSKIMLSMAMGMIVLVAPLQLVVGDMHGLNTLEYQPAKVAAMEGHWETRTGAPLVLFGIPDETAERNRLEIAIPKLGSLILTHDPEGEVRGLKSWPESERPPVAIVFWSFRLMVGLGLLMILLGATGTVLRWRGRLYDTPWFLQACRLMSPMGFIAVLAGWMVAEVGRQPYVVYGLMYTADAVSPVPTGSVAASLIVFIVSYTVIFAAGIYYILRLLRNGPEDSEPAFSGRDSQTVKSLPARENTAEETKGAGS